MISQPDEQVDAQQRFRQVLQRSLLWLFAVAAALGLTLILALDLVSGPQLTVEIGEPAPNDVYAPRSITYVSRYLTDLEKRQAAADVPDVYTSPDLAIGKAQSNRARAVFSFVDVVRSDAVADRNAKLRYLQGIEGLSLDPQVMDDLLNLDPADFTVAREDVLRIIEETMRDGVVDDQLALGEAQREAARDFSFVLTSAQERVVVALAPQFIVPNIFLDEEATAGRREEAAADVEPVTQFIGREDRILRANETVDEEDYEKLEQLHLLERTLDWPQLGGTLLASVLAVTVITLYWQRFFDQQLEAGRSLLLLGTLLLLFVLGAKLLVPTRTEFVYLYPAAALSMLLAVIFDTRLALVIMMVLAGLVGYIAEDSLELAVYVATGGTVAVLTLRDPQRINALFRAGMVVAVVNLAVVLMFRLPQDAEPAELMWLLLFAFLNGLIISSGLSLAGIFLIGSLFGIITTLQLQELSRLDHPLLQELLRRAPGTYHHSIMVANLAEQAAERIKANSTLVRVGAFYHDVGKMNRPPFFTENQNGGNPHDTLDPYSSARIILSHVPDGLELARRYHLPNRIRDFIAEHHGDRVLKIFCQKAKEMAGDDRPVDVSRFRYKGPRPRSRETGIVQLADSIEAASSALHPSTEEEIEKLVTSIVDDHLKEGQLDCSGLTLGDVKLLKESFIKTLKGRFHVRVRYPGNEELALTESEAMGLTGLGNQVEPPPATTDIALPRVLANHTAAPPTRPAIVKELDEPVRR
ncbi:MAG: HDIG domain-containing protein [Chloroflexi bacterium]|nr:HDIG domain-containing protein [Chloroflexota bacterium]